MDGSSVNVLLLLIVGMLILLKWVSSGVLDSIPTTVLGDYPNSKALMKRVLIKPVDGIEKWMGKYSKPYSSFEYEP